MIFNFQTQFPSVNKVPILIWELMRNRERSRLKNNICQVQMCKQIVFVINCMCGNWTKTNQYVITREWPPEEVQAAVELFKLCYFSLTLTKWPLTLSLHWPKNPFKPTHIWLLCAIWMHIGDLLKAVVTCIYCLGLSCDANTNCRWTRWFTLIFRRDALTCVEVTVAGLLICFNLFRSVSAEFERERSNE